MEMDQTNHNVSYQRELSSTEGVEFKSVNFCIKTILARA